MFLRKTCHEPFITRLAELMNGKAGCRTAAASPKQNTVSTKKTYLSNHESNSKVNLACLDPNLHGRSADTGCRSVFHQSDVNQLCRRARQKHAHSDPHTGSGGSANVGRRIPKCQRL